MKRLLFLYIVILLCTLSLSAEDKKIHILLIEELHESKKAEKSVIQDYFARPGLEITILDPERHDWKHLDTGTYDIVWLHDADSSKGTLPVKRQSLIKSILDYLEAGGNLLLTQHALAFLNESGLEPTQLQNRTKSSSDNGYGRMLGFHSFIGHPLFDSLNGGAYIWKPPNDTLVSQCGFFGERAPENGKVVAVDWDYIFVREDAKLILEYEYGQGKILGIGAYFNLEHPNVNKAHFDLFYRNVFIYLSQKKEGQQKHYWSYEKANIRPLDFVLKRQLIPPPSRQWETDKPTLELRRAKARGEYCELAGRRLLLTAYEPGGIFELWAHPFMALRDYMVTLSFDGDSSRVQLSSLSPAISVSPESITRVYGFENGAVLKEISSVSPEDPVGLIHYEYTGPKALIRMGYKSNMRLMWPYSGEVVKEITYGYQPGLNAQEITAAGIPLSTFTGASKPMYRQHMHGSRNNGVDSTMAVVSDFSFSLEEEDYLDIVFAAGNEDRDSIIACYMKAIQDPAQIFHDAKKHFKEVLNNHLLIHSPDKNFNQGYAWSLAATDRFFVETPGLGTSLVAGYNGTDRGWDGGHRVNGRPGYAWYFGRDAVWSAMAILAYGDFEGVREVLDMLIRYQDLSGKIFHELSTSGFVHYDASDATPLFIILAGRYLMHSGDSAYIRQNWPAIQKALDYCFATDTDGDGLIENTNVGHGWVEGGHLFGSHTSLYLASCWSEALTQAGYMMQAAGTGQHAADYQLLGLQIRNRLSTDFLNPENAFLYQGIFRDGSFHKGVSIMPAVPIAFGQIPSLVAEGMLNAYASSDYTTDWGVRMSPASSPHYHPAGYHSGAVWPLYTGWVALAEYNQKRSVQGFGHIMSNLNIYNDFSLGYLEEVLNGAVYKPGGVCPHQCWSETMVLQPVIEGMLGLRPDAMGHKLAFKPALPAEWDHLAVDNIRIGNKKINWSMQKEKGMTVYTFTGELAGTDIYFEPVLADGTIVHKILINGREEMINICTACQGTTLKLDLQMESDTRIEIFHEGGISLLAPQSRPAAGEPSQGVRIIETRWENNTYTIWLEGDAANRYTLKLMNNFGTPSTVEGAVFRQKDNILELDPGFPANMQGYSEREIKIKF